MARRRIRGRQRAGRAVIGDFDAAGEQVAGKGQRVAGAVGDMQIEVGGPVGIANPAGRISSIRMSKAPLRPLPVFSTMIA